jgi:hypothetical protein
VKFLLKFNILKKKQILYFNSFNKLSLIFFILRNFKKFDYIFITTPKTNKLLFFSKLLFPKKIYYSNINFNNRNTDIVKEDKKILEKILNKKINYFLENFNFLIKDI